QPADAPPDRLGTDARHARDGGPGAGRQRADAGLRAPSRLRPAPPAGGAGCDGGAAGADLSYLTVIRVIHVVHVNHVMAGLVPAIPTAAVPSVSRSIPTVRARWMA